MSIENSNLLQKPTRFQQVITNEKVRFGLMALGIVIALLPAVMYLAGVNFSINDQDFDKYWTAGLCGVVGIAIAGVAEALYRKHKDRVQLYQDMNDLIDMITEPNVVKIAMTSKADNDGIIENFQVVEVIPLSYEERETYKAQVKELLDRIVNNPHFASMEFPDEYNEPIFVIFKNSAQEKANIALEVLLGNATYKGKFLPFIVYDRKANVYHKKDSRFCEKIKENYGLDIEFIASQVTITEEV